MNQTVYVVYEGDGYECVDLVAIFDSLDEAVARARKQRLDCIKKNNDFYASKISSYDWAGFVSVEANELNTFPIKRKSLKHFSLDGEVDF